MEEINLKELLMYIRKYILFIITDKILPHRLNHKNTRTHSQQNYDCFRNAEK